MGKKRKRNISKEIIASLQDGVAWAKGEIDLPTSVPTAHLNHDQKIQAIMDFGFVIYTTTNNGPYAIAKVRTPKAPSDEIPEGLGTRGHESFDAALEAVLAHLGDTDPRQERTWTVRVGFNRGLGTEFRELGKIESPSYPKAYSRGTFMAKEFFLANPDLGDTPYEVKVRPADS